MKFNFKFLLAGIILPAGFISFGTNTANIEAKPEQIVPKPYVIEVNSETGVVTGSFVGNSRLTDPYLISGELGAEPFTQDKFSVFPDIKMGMGGKITIYRAPKFIVVDGRKKLELRSWSKTVGELLSENHVDLGDDDKTNFSKDTDLELGMQINIIRVAITNVHKSESIDFKTIKKEDKTLDKGKTRIEQKGVLGTRVLTYQVRREDGVEVSRRLTNTEVTQAPVDEIQIIGTKPVITGWCRYNDWVLDASIKNGLDPDKLCNLMHIESNGHPDSSGQGGAHLGLFQYDPGFWASVSAKAGYAGADIFDPRAQIYTTAWALTHGYAGRW